MNVAQLVDALDSVDSDVELYVRLGSELHPVIAITTGPATWGAVAPEILTVVADHTEVLA